MSTKELNDKNAQLQHLQELEQSIAQEEHGVDPAFSVQVMDKIESYEPQWMNQWVRRLTMFRKKFVFPVAAIATACIAFTLVGRDGVSRRVEPVVKVSGGYEERADSNSPVSQVKEATTNRAIEAKPLPEKEQDSALEVFEPVSTGKAGRKGTIAENKTNFALKAAEVRQRKQAMPSIQDALDQPTISDQLASVPARTFFEEATIRGKRPERMHIMPPVPSFARPTSGEVYGDYDENPRFQVSVEPLSTFGFDVDTGSYTNARRFLRMGQLPPKNSVRVEEFLNYFSYDYPQVKDKPFAVYYEIAPSPLEPERYFLKLSVKAKDAIREDNGQGWNLVFLVDVSGSMSSENKLPLLKRSLKVLVNKMRPKDRIAIVTYAGNAGTALESTPGSEKEKIISVIEGLGSGGSTHGSAGIEAAYRIAEANRIKGSVNRVILATDGDFNVGTTSFDGLIKLVEKKRKTGVTLTTLGFGGGNYKEKNLEQLANKGNGNYFYLDSFREARKVLDRDLVANLEMVAKDVKLQIEFNPEQVVDYRLIGFDNRRLNKEDFANDKIDAGEVGSGHTVTVVYELTLANTGLAKKVATELRYQSKKEQPRKIVVPEQLSKELAFVKIRYKEIDSDTSKLIEYPLATSQIKHEADKTSDELKFVSAVAYFGQMLRESKYSGSYTFSDIAELARKSMGEDPFGYRKEFVDLVENAAVEQPQ